MKLFLAAFALLVSSAIFAETRVVTLSVPDMNCPTCPITVKKGLERVQGIVVEDVDLKTRTARVAVSDSNISNAQLIQATTDVGYPSSIAQEQNNGTD